MTLLSEWHIFGNGRFFFKINRSIRPQQTSLHYSIILLLLLSIGIVGSQAPVVFSDSLTVTEDFDGYQIYTLRGTDANASETLRYLITKIPEKLHLFQYSLLFTGNPSMEYIDPSIRTKSLVRDSGGRILISAKFPNNLIGLDNFTFIAENSQYVASNEGLISITITPAPDLPRPNSYFQHSLYEDTPSWIVLCPTCDDFDDPAVALVFTLNSLPSAGVMYDLVEQRLVRITTLPHRVQSPNASIYFFPVVDSNIWWSTFAIVLSTGTISVPVTVQLYIMQVNDPPVATSLNITTNEDIPIIITPNCSDVDSDQITHRLISSPPRHRLFQFLNYKSATFGSPLISNIDDSNGTFWFVPAKNFFGKTFLIYECLDSDGARSNRGNITITVNPVNDAPTDTCAQKFNLPFNFLSGKSNFVSIPIFAEDVDDNILHVKIHSTPERGFLADSNGTVLNPGDSTLITALRFYSNYSGGGYPYGNFSYTVIDTDGATTDNCTINFEISCEPLYMNIFSNGSGYICEPCPLGANCSVTGKHAPIAATGYWKVPGRDDLYLTCDPPSSCPGLSSEICARGYRGIRCGGCEYGYYRRNKQCLQCSGDEFNRSVLQAVGYVLALVFIIQAILGFVNSSSVGVIWIVIFFLQSLLVIGKIDINWPTLFKDFLHVLEVFRISEEYIMTECFLASLPHDDNHHKMWRSLVLPMLLWTASIAAVGLQVIGTKMRNSWKEAKTGLVPSFTRGKPAQNDRQLVINSIRITHIVLFISYLNIVRSIVSLFDCSTSLDGNAYLDSEIGVMCYTEEWHDLVPLAILGISVLVVGIPTYFSILLYMKYFPKFSKALKSRCTQLLTFGHSYKDEEAYFIVIQLAMKVVLICGKLFFSGRPALQVVSAYVVFLIDFFLHMLLRPYISNELNTFRTVGSCCEQLILLFGLYHDRAIADNSMNSESSNIVVGVILVAIVTIYLVAAIGWSLYNCVSYNFTSKFKREKADTKPPPSRESQYYM